MPKEEGFSGLFDIVSRREKKKKKEQEEKAPLVQIPEKEKLPPIGNLDETMEKYKKMHDELKSGIEDSFSKAGLTPKKVEEYYSNPARFTLKAWREIQSAKEELEEKLERLLPGGRRVKKTEEKETKKPTKRQLERKRWLSMH
jgi:hypothetical protein